MSRWRLFPLRRRSEPDAERVIKMLRALQGDTALRLIEGLVGLDVRGRPQRISDALERAAAAVLETACISVDMALPAEALPRMEDVRDRLDAARGVLDDLRDRLDAVRSGTELVNAEAGARDTLERMSQLATVHAAMAGAVLAIEPIMAVPGSVERRLVELEEATVDALGELEAAVRNL